MPDRSLTVRLRAEVAQFKAEIGSAAASLNGMAAKVTAADREGKKLREGLTTLGGQAGKVGLVAAAGLGYAIKSAADFNAEMALVKTLSHASASDMDKLSQAALTVGQNIGYSAKAVAAGEEEMIKAGVSVKDILGGGLKGALDLAAAGQTDVATATEIAAAAMTEFGLSGKDIPHLADELAAGADKALGSVEDLGQGLTQAGTTAAQMGLTLEQTVGTLTAFAQAGLIGERGGTTFKQMLLQLSSPSAAAQKQMDKFGISLYNTSGQIKTMPELADNLQKSLSGISPKARNAALGIIFGARAIQGANILLANGKEGIQGWIDKTNDQGFAAQQAGGKLDSLSGDVKKLGAAMQSAFIGVGNGNQGPLREMVQDATSVVTAFNKMPGPIKGVASDLLLITAVTGGGLWFGSKVINGITNTRTALENLGPAGQRASGKLGSIATRAGGILAVAAAVNVLGRALDDSVGNNVKSEDLGRELEALANGRSSGSLDSVADSLHGLEERGAGVANALFKIPGAIVGVRTSFQHNTDVVKTFDEQLATLVESGKADEAAKVFGRIADAAHDQGVSVDETRSHFKQYQLALQNVEDAQLANSGAAKIMKGALNGLLDPTVALGGKTKASAEDQEALAKALEDSRKAANDTAHQFFGLGKSVDDSKVSLNGWIKDLEKQAGALRDFTKNAQTAGKRGLKEGLIAELEKAGPTGALRMKQLADASDAEIKRANRAWREGQRAIDKYTDVVGGVPDAVATDLHVNGVPGAISAVRALKSLMDSLHDRSININVTKHTNATLAEADANSGGKKHAIGGLVMGPGTSTSDSIPAYLSNREYVVSADAVEHYGVRFFDAANAKRLAAGGPAQPAMYESRRTTLLTSGGGVAGQSIDYGRLGASVAAALSGDRLLDFRDARDAHLAALRTVFRELPPQRVQQDASLLYGAA